MWRIYLTCVCIYIISVYWWNQGSKWPWILYRFSYSLLWWLSVVAMMMCPPSIQHWWVPPHTIDKYITHSTQHSNLSSGELTTWKPWRTGPNDPYHSLEHIQSDAQWCVAERRTEKILRNLPLGSNSHQLPPQYNMAVSSKNQSQLMSSLGRSHSQHWKHS